MAHIIRRCIITQSKLNTGQNIKKNIHLSKSKHVI